MDFSKYMNLKLKRKEKEKERDVLKGYSIKGCADISCASYLVCLELRVGRSIFLHTPKVLWGGWAQCGAHFVENKYRMYVPRPTPENSGVHVDIALPPNQKIHRIDLDLKLPTWKEHACSAPFSRIYRVWELTKPPNI